MLRSGGLQSDSMFGALFNRFTELLVGALSPHDHWGERRPSRAGDWVVTVVRPFASLVLQKPCNVFALYYDWASSFCSLLS